MYYSATAVETQNDEYKLNAPKWKKIRNVLSNDVVEYLRDAGKNEPTDPEKAARQQEYIDGSYFLDFTSPTFNAYSKSMFMSEPDINIAEKAPEIAYLLENVDGSGNGLIQQMKRASFDICTIGNGLLWVDMPGSDGNTAKVDQQGGGSSARIIFYPAESIIDWRTETINGTEVLVWLKLAELVTNDVNEFERTYYTQYRILQLNSNGHYTKRLVTPYNPPEGTKREQGQDYTELQVFYNESTRDFGIEVKEDGQFMTSIPVYPIGVMSNDWHIDKAPAYSMSCLNIAHYRNTADHEEELSMIAQKMLAIYPNERVTPEEWHKFNPNGVRFGSRVGITVPGGKAEILEPTSGGSLESALRRKEEQALSIGAELTRTDGDSTATASRIQRGSTVATLSGVCDNISSAYTEASKQVARFNGLKDDEISIQLQKSFFFEKATAQERAQWMAEVNSGILPVSTYYSWLRNRGEIDLSDDEIKSELESGGMGGPQGIE